jgi:hypothetical protein
VEVRFYFISAISSCKFNGFIEFVDSYESYKNSIIDSFIHCMEVIDRIIFIIFSVHIAMEIALGLYMDSDTAKIHLLGLGLVSPLKGGQQANGLSSLGPIMMPKWLQRVSVVSEFRLLG